MAMSPYMREKMIGITYNGKSFTPPTNFYLVLYTSTGPTALDPFANELVGGGYVRIEWFPTEAVAPDWIVWNNAEIVLPIATVDWDIINHIGIVDNLGNLLDYGPVITPRTILAGGTYRARTGEIYIQYPL